MDIQPIAFEGGFSDAVFDAQTVFRALMNAMAEPGTRQATGSLANPPAPLSPSAGAVALTLCDHDTAVWLDPVLDTPIIRAWLQFQTGTVIADDPARAQIAFVADAGSMPRFDRFAQGSQEYPDRSTTIVIQVDGLDTGPALTLSGPGIATQAMLAPSALPDDFRAQWQDNGARFPRGVDLVFAAPSAIACLPRTTRVAEAMEA